MDSLWRDRHFPWEITLPERFPLELHTQAAYPPWIGVRTLIKGKLKGQIGAVMVNETFNQSALDEWTRSNT